MPRERTGNTGAKSIEELRDKYRGAMFHHVWVNTELLAFPGPEPFTGERLLKWDALRQAEKDAEQAERQARDAFIKAVKRLRESGKQERKKGT